MLKMNRSGNHSWLSHGCPCRVEEKGSLRKSLWFCAMSCPVFKCHHRSGSVRLRAAIAARPTARISVKVREVVSKSRIDCAHHYNSGLDEIHPEEIGALSERYAAVELLFVVADASVNKSGPAGLHDLLQRGENPPTR